MNEALYEKISDALVNDGYLVIDEALPTTLLQKLLQLATEESLYKKAGISQTKKLHIDSTKRRDKILWLDEDGGAQSEYLEFMQGLQNYLNRSLYLGLNEYESHFALYEVGDFYEKHVDAFQNSKNRCVTTVLYLNEEWSTPDGGELLLYSEEDVLIQRVLPKGGRLLLFLSERFPHEVLPTKRSRYSIAGWFRVDGKRV